MTHAELFAAINAGEAMTLSRRTDTEIGEVPTHHGGLFWGASAPSARLLGYADGRQWVRLDNGEVISRRPESPFRRLAQSATPIAFSPTPD